MRMLQLRITDPSHPNEDWQDVPPNPDGEPPYRAGDLKVAYEILTDFICPEEVNWRYSNGVVNSFRLKPTAYVVELRDKYGQLVQTFEPTIGMALRQYHHAKDIDTIHYFGPFRKGQRYTLEMVEVD